MEKCEKCKGLTFKSISLNAKHTEEVKSDQNARLALNILGYYKNM